MTALYEGIIFGPIRSRRLGLSLGINLPPEDCKLCSFECVYCECGWKHTVPYPKFHRREDVRECLRETLTEMVADGTPPDSITFAGNGEPTLHPHFAEIVDDAIAIRDSVSPTSRLSVLSNATMIGKPEIREALMRLDNNILKLDSALDATVRLINDPCGSYSVRETVENMKLFNGRLIVQTMFLRGEIHGQKVDNTSEEELSAWLRVIREIAPSKIMIYSLDRDTPLHTIEKIPADELTRIAGRVMRETGIECAAAL